jgi:hypothetical protein
MSNHHQAHRMTTAHNGQSLRSIQEQTNLLKDIKQNTSETTINAGDIELHVDGLEALQTTANGHLATVAGAVSGSEMQVDVLTMPTVAVTLAGGATEAKQDDGITHLATIAGDTTI